MSTKRAVWRLNLRRVSIVFLFYVSATTVVTLTAGRLPEATGPFVPDQILVKARAHVPEAAVANLLAAHGAREVGVIAPIGVRIIRVSEAARVKVLEALQRHEDVEFAEGDAVVAPSLVPNDPSYPNQWHLPKIAASSAWDLTCGSSGTIIAILDTGVDGTHPDLAGKIVPGWNTYDNNADTSDVYGHGTAVAGSATAAGNNGIGVASVAWGCRLMPMRISDLNGYGYSSTISAALTWAADHGARVANISYRLDFSATVTTAAQYFMSKGGVVTMSAGNEATLVTAADNPSIIVVSATDSADRLASWSNYGNNIDVAAPGVSILTTSRGGGYGYWSGTSFSAPITAGVAALVISANPALSAEEVRDLVIESADDLGASGWDTIYGGGRVNAAKAVDVALTFDADTVAPTTSITDPSPGAVVSGQVTITASAADDRGVTGVQLYLDGVLVGSSAAATAQFAWDTTAAVDGEHTLQSTAFDAAGNTGASTVVGVTVKNQEADTVSPTVAITSPASGTTVTQSVKVKVVAADNVGVTKVELYLDGVKVGTSTEASVVFTVKTNKLAKGLHSLVAKARDAAGNESASATVTIKK
ncbi:MAG TPA: S8 family serine peptidase [Verrucomicrobiota bacterium]|nr:S8 family serine peptidase [Verrucomicrobiota bacterium]HNU52410.1 S8 family serine peptidase [Verrucomicrobiota bacterium]